MSEIEEMKQRHQALLHRFGLYINNDQRWLYHARDAYKGRREGEGSGAYTGAIMTRLLKEVWEYDNKFRDGEKPTRWVTALLVCHGPDQDFGPIFDEIYLED